MKIIKPYYLIESEIDPDKILKNIEKAGRTCYKSEDKITGFSAKDFVRMIMKRGHLSVLEHENITVRFICDRGISHELVRHRIASFSQESTRYANYSKDRFGNEITVIEPCFFKESPDLYFIWLNGCMLAEHCYFQLLNNGMKPEEARSVLPNSLKTEIVITANLREWIHILELRTSKQAHPQMRELITPLQEELSDLLPDIFRR